MRCQVYIEMYAFPPKQMELHGTGLLVLKAAEMCLYRNHDQATQEIKELTETISRWELFSFCCPLAVQEHNAT